MPSVGLNLSKLEGCRSSMTLANCSTIQKRVVTNVSRAWAQATPTRVAIGVATGLIVGTTITAIVGVVVVNRVKPENQASTIGTMTWITGVTLGSTGLIATFVGACVTEKIDVVRAITFLAVVVVVTSVTTVAFGQLVASQIKY